MKKGSTIIRVFRVFRVFRFFKSIKLALVLIGYLVVTSILASLIPQGREMAFYAHDFPAPIYNLIVTLNLNNFFRSLFFLIPLGLFTINLSVCTMDRIISRIKHRAPLRLGPDIIHIGLLILILAGLITLFQRREGFVFLSPGDSVELPNGYQLTLKNFTFQIYPDRRPKRWISELEVTKQKAQASLTATKPKSQRVTIEVNRPFRIKSLNIFQYSYKDLSTVTLKKLHGPSVTIHPGNRFRIGDSIYKFIRVSTEPSGLTTTVTPKAATLKDTKGAKSKATGTPGLDNQNLPQTLYAVFIQTGENVKHPEFKILSPGSKLGNYTLSQVVPRLESGLNVVYDPGFTPIIIGLLLVGLGLTLTLVQKIGDKKL